MLLPGGIARMDDCMASKGVFGCIFVYLTSILTIGLACISKSDVWYTCCWMSQSSLNATCACMEQLNAAKLTPRQDHASKCLIRGGLQMPEGLHLLIDETTMQPGQLNASGISNLQVECLVSVGATIVQAA